MVISSEDLFTHTDAGFGVEDVENGVEYPCEDVFRKDGVSIFVSTTEEAHFKRFPEQITLQDLLKTEGVRLDRIE